MVTFHIITVGNELLTGKTLNTNVQWLADKINRLGGYVARSVSIRDDVDEIAEEIRYSLERGAEWIIISGGLGPTYDDKTLQGLAKALGVGLRVDEEAYGMVEKRYCLLGKPGMTPARVKMATLPEGSKPLPNPVGTAPGVVVEKNSRIIICLPGVPEEMKAIFEASIMGWVRERIGEAEYRDAMLRVSGIGESLLAPAIDQVVKRNPKVYVKSHPRLGEGRAWLEIHISTTARTGTEADEDVRKALEDMKRLIEEYGGSVEDVK